MEARENCVSHLFKSYVSLNHKKYKTKIRNGGILEWVLLNFLRFNFSVCFDRLINSEWGNSICLLRKVYQ